MFTSTTHTHFVDTGPPSVTTTKISDPSAKFSGAAVGCETFADTQITDRTGVGSTTA